LVPVVSVHLDDVSFEVVHVLAEHFVNMTGVAERDVAVAPAETGFHVEDHLAPGHLAELREVTSEFLAGHSPRQVVYVQRQTFRSSRHVERVFACRGDGRCGVVALHWENLGYLNTYSSQSSRKFKMTTVKCRHIF